MKRSLLRWSFILSFTVCLTIFLASDSNGQRNLQSVKSDSNSSQNKFVDPLLADVFEALNGHQQTIDSIGFYAVPVEAERKFSYAVQKRRLHAFICFRCGEHCGWAEANLGYDPDQKPFVKRLWRMDWYRDLKGRTVADALRDVIARRPKNYRELEYAEIALLDLAGKITGKPTLELLNLNGRKPTAGVYCILSDDPVKVAELAGVAVRQKMTSHIKVKLFGNVDTDTKVIQAARRVIGDSAYVVGDVNFGYRRDAIEENIDEIGTAMQTLKAAGLSACEDPAAMNIKQWSELQQMVPELDLIPDVPLRPSWDALNQIDRDMGRVFNMHPGCMGSYIETIRLGSKIKSWGRKLMVGDASLVGVGCPAWQQLAIGLEANWVEAVEKPHENNVFQRCVVKNAVSRNEEGKFVIRKLAPGFGFEVDERKLNRLASEKIEF